MKEEWRDIPGLEGYQASNIGRVKSLRKKQEYIMKQRPGKHEYPTVSITIKRKNTQRKVHRLVALAFIKNPDNKTELNHKDGNKKNNRADNLEWSTRSENIRHAFKTGLRKNKGTHIGNWKGYINIFSKDGVFLTQAENTKLAALWIRENTAHETAVWQSIKDVCNGKHNTAYNLIFQYSSEKIK